MAPVALCLCALAPIGTAAAATRAGTAIVNTATLSFAPDGAPQPPMQIASNTVSLTTAEDLDVTIAADRPAIVVQPGTVAVGFVIANTGNGAEDFALAIASDQSGVAVTRVAIDTNNDGVYDPATDTLLAAGAPLSLAPGQQVRVFVLVDGAQVTAATQISASVTARTGTGTPGTVFAGAGEGGGDAVVGTTGAAATASSQLTPAAGLPSLVKSQSVFAPDGSARAVRGSIVTYRLVASFTAATRGVAIDDPIPAGTDYVPGSLALDDRPLTDASDTDAGSVDASAIHVALGTIAAAGTRTIQFSVKIQ